MFRFRPYRFPRPKGRVVRHFPLYRGQTTAEYIACFVRLNFLKD